jgi:hypothetical protein
LLLSICAVIEEFRFLEELVPATGKVRDKKDEPRNSAPQEIDLGATVD